MANPNKPSGLSPVMTLSGSPWTGKGNIYCIPQADTNAYYPGDLVALAGSADANGVPTITIGTAGAAAVGVYMGGGGLQAGGPYVDPSNLDSGTIIPATKTKAYYVEVVDDPNIIFEIQEIGTGTQFTAAEVGLNANIIAAAPATGVKVSATMLDNTTEATTSTLNLKLLRLAPRPYENAFGAFAKWWVLINNHSFRTGVTGT